VAPAVRRFPGDVLRLKWGCLDRHRWQRLPESFEIPRKAEVVLENQPPTINIVMDEKVAQGDFVNFANIIHSPSEFIIDLGRVVPGRAEVRIYDRVIMTPLHAKQLLQALAQNITLFEQKYGEIRLDIAQGFAAASEPSN
jgi:hypothetical protein